MDDMYLYDRYEDALESEVSTNTKENTSSYYNQEDLNNILDDYEKFINHINISFFSIKLYLKIRPRKSFRILDGCKGKCIN